MGNRMYGKENCTVFTLGATSILTQIATGNISIEATEIENSALLDAWRSHAYGPKVATVEIDGAMEDADGVDWLTLAATTIALVITTTRHSITGNFGNSSAKETIGDAIRNGGTLKSIGAVTIA